MKKIATILSMLLVLSLTACHNPDNSTEDVDKTQSLLTAQTDAYPDNSTEDVNKTNKVTNQYYIANKNSGKLHYYTCDSLPDEYNSVYFSSESEANDAGYTNNHKECMGH